MRRRPTKEQFQQQLQQMVQTIRDDILAGVYPAGDYLPSEKTLVSRFGMSNNSIRIGLEQLVEEGWIEKVARVGNRVAPGRPPVKLKLLCNEMPLRNLKLRQLLDGFHKKYPWITVETTVAAGLLGLGSKEEPIPGDVVLLTSYQFQQAAEEGKTVWLEETAENPAIYPQVNALYRHKDVMYMQPLIFSPIMLCYNKSHFRESGLLEPDGSWRWDDLIRHAELLSDGKSRYGFCFHIPDGNRWPVFLLQSMERFEWDENGKLKDLRGSKLMESIQICKRIILNAKAFPRYLSESNDDIDRMFMEGKVSMTLTSYMALNGLIDSGLEYDVSPMPFIREMRTLGIALGAGVLRQSGRKEEAALLVDYLTSVEGQTFIRTNTMSVPSVGNLPGPPENGGMYRPSRAMMYREILSSLRTHGELNVSLQTLYGIGNLLKGYWADLIDEEELCSRLSDQLSKPQTIREAAPAGDWG